MGHELTSVGLKPDPDKIEAILNMKTPTNVKCSVKTIRCV